MVTFIVFVGCCSLGFVVFSCKDILELHIAIKVITRFVHVKLGENGLYVEFSAKAEELFCTMWRLC